MAAVTTTALLVGAAVTAGTSVYGAVSSNKRAKDARKAIEDYERQELVNYAELQGYSIKAEEIQSAEAARTTATEIDMVSKLGARGVGAASLISQRSDLTQAKISANIDQKIEEYKNIATQGAMQVQQMQEARESQDIAGLGQMYNVARQETAGWIQQGANALAAGATAFGNTGTTSATTGSATPQVTDNQNPLTMSAFSGQDVTQLKLDSPGGYNYNQFMNEEALDSIYKYGGQ